MNWVTMKGRSYENRCLYNNGRLAICAKELVHGGKYSPDCLPLVEVDEETPLLSSPSSFSLGDRILVNPAYKLNGVRQLVSIYIIYKILFIFSYKNSLCYLLVDWNYWDRG